MGGGTVKVPGRELKPQPSCFEVAALTTAPPCCHVEMIDSNFLCRHSKSIFHCPQSCDPINTAPRPSFGVMKRNIGSCSLLATCWGCAASGAEVVEGSITASCKNQHLDVCVHIKAVIVCVRCVLVTMVLVLKHKSLFASQATNSGAKFTWNWSSYCTTWCSVKLLSETVFASSGDVSLVISFYKPVRCSSIAHHWITIEIQ